MAEKTPVKRKVTRQKSEADLKSLRNFIEELSWFLSSHSRIDFQAAVELLGELSQHQNKPLGVGSKNPNIDFLVGALPGVFSDQKYFPTNEDIVDFAQQALNLNIVRWEKRSRYELIGLIVCETVKLNDTALTKLSDALSKVVANDVVAKKILRTRAQNKLSWNEVIQQLSGRSSNDDNY